MKRKIENLSIKGLVRHQPPDFSDSHDPQILKGDLDDLRWITKAPINAQVVPTKHPSHSGGDGLSRKYYVTAVKEPPHIAALRPPIMRDDVRTSSDTHPPVVDDLGKRLHRK